MPKADFVTAIVLFLFGITVAALSYSMPKMEHLGAHPSSVPGLVPGALGVAIALFSIPIFVRALKNRGYRLGLSGKVLLGFLKAESTRRILVTVLVSIVYALVLLGRMHFIAATSIYIFAFVMFFEYKPREPLAGQWKTVLFALILALVTAVAVFIAFQYGFLVNLP